MANTNFLPTNELDFRDLKENLKTFLKSQDQFADYDFDGSNLNVLLDILAYNTYLNSFYLNMVGSEMFLDTSMLKESAVSHAKELNYLPRSRASAMALVDIIITPDDAPDSIIIPANYKVQTMVDNLGMYFYTNEDHIVTANNGVYSAANVAIYEGMLVNEYYDVTPDTRFVLQSETVDTRSIKVHVYESNTTSVNYPYMQASSLFGLTPSSNVFFVHGYRSNQYEIAFGNGVTGRKLTNGNRVKIEYRSTNGTLGNGAYGFSRTGSIQGYELVSIATRAAAAYGAERETIDQIKFNAPRFFTTQERAVTSQDYINLTMEKFPQFQAVAAYGGEEMTPPQYGKVAISLKPYGSTSVVSDALKAEVVDYLNLKNMTTEPIIVDPDILYLRVDTDVKYNTQETVKGINTLRTAIKNAIVDFGSQNLDKFGTDFSYSKLTSVIDSVDDSIMGNETAVHLSKRWTPLPQISNTITFSFNNELHHEEMLYELPQGHELTVESSTFEYVAGNTTYTAYVGDNGLGILKIYTDSITNGVATRISLNDNAGTVDYYTGDITLTANVDSYTGSHINIRGTLYNKDVMIKRNGFLIISPQDVNVTMNPVTE